MFGRKAPARPTIRQFGELGPGDFEQHPVWIACHSADDNEPWFDQTDEESFRPWTGPLPVSSDEGMLLVAADFALADGSQHPGFVTPSDEPDLGLQQPHIFAKGRAHGFWGGLFGVAPVQREALFEALGRNPAAIFPAEFSARADLARGSTSGTVYGFLRLRDGQVIIDR